MDLKSGIMLLFCLPMASSYYVADKCNKNQSPIDIKTRDLIYKDELVPFRFKHYGNTGNLQVWTSNNGSLKLLYKDGESSWLQGGTLPDEYKFMQVHFLWPTKDSGQDGSEHTINCQAAAMEMRLAHFKHSDNPLDIYRPPLGALAMLSFLIDADAEEDHPQFEALYKELTEFQPHVYYKIGLKIPMTLVRDLFVDPARPNAPHHFMRYLGSVTERNCTHGVIWSIMEKRLKISASQFAKFRTLFDEFDHKRQNNYHRPTQPIDDRIVYASDPKHRHRAGPRYRECIKTTTPEPTTTTTILYNVTAKIGKIVLQTEEDDGGHGGPVAAVVTVLTLAGLAAVGGALYYRRRRGGEGLFTAGIFNKCIKADGEKEKTDACREDEEKDREHLVGEAGQSGINTSTLSECYQNINEDFSKNEDKNCSNQKSLKEVTLDLATKKVEGIANNMPKSVGVDHLTDTLVKQADDKETANATADEAEVTPVTPVTSSTPITPSAPVTPLTKVTAGADVKDERFAFADDATVDLKAAEKQQDELL